MDVNIPSDWKSVLAEEFTKKYFLALEDFVDSEYRSCACYPPVSEVFSCFRHTPFKDVKVVILGQDPYHNAGEANGLAFSVNDGIKIPPSLRNIFKELQNDLLLNLPTTGNLERWADQGVLLLNATLTVRENTPGSHQNKGWEKFTDAVIAKLSEECEGIVFLLWGKYAQKKGMTIDTTKHKVIERNHPSPLSVWRGNWFNTEQFSKVNKHLIGIGKEPINW